MLNLGQVTLHVFLFLRGGEQAKLGTAPQDVLRLSRPFFGTQVIDFAGVQATAEVVAQVANTCTEDGVG